MRIIVLCLSFILFLSCTSSQHPSPNNAVGKLQAADVGGSNYNPKVHDPAQEDLARSPAAHLQKTTLRSYKPATIENKYKLAPLSQSENAKAKAALSAPNQVPLKVGIARQTPSNVRLKFTTTQWTPLNGGRVTSISVTSPGAKALRLAVKVKNFANNGQLRFFNPSKNSISFGPYTKERLIIQPEANTKGTKAAPSDKYAGSIWSPVIDGDTVGVEIWVPEGESTSDVDIAFPAVSHLELSPLSGNQTEEEEDCVKDVACRPPGEIERSVAKFTFVDGGDTYLCTGQLMNSTDSSYRPNYFSTANHCVPTHDIARTMDFYWGYQRSSCGGSIPTSVTQTTDGADLLRTGNVDTSTDFSLVLLKSSPPSNAFYSGWTSSTPSMGASTVNVSHPHGWTKKVAYGSITGFDNWEDQTFNSHIKNSWSYGSVEGGSSGSGLWSNNKLIGVLTGGPTGTCSTYDLYGRFDYSYDWTYQWLNPSALDTTALGAHEGGNLDGKTFKVYRLSKNSGSGSITVTLRPQSGDSDLYIHSGFAPSFNTYTCKSAKVGTEVDSCTITLSSTKDTYIAVYAYSTSGTSYSLDIGGGSGNPTPTPNASPRPTPGPTPQPSPPSGEVVPPPTASPVCNVNALCLNNGRFKFMASWKNQFNGSTGTAAPIKNTDVAGFLHFGDPTNVELIMKVLDFGSHFKFFYGQLTNLKFNIKVIDSQTGSVKYYQNTAGNCGGIDNNAFAFMDRLNEPLHNFINKDERAPASGNCSANQNTLCLQGGRIKITATWRNHYNNVTGTSMVRPLSVATGGLYFSDPSNLELLVKALDFGSHYLIMYGTLSDLEYTMKVTDTVTGRTKDFFNTGGNYCGGLDQSTFTK